MASELPGVLVTALILGLVGGITPGPVLAAAFTGVLQAGLLRALAVVLWALLIETLVALVSLLVLASGRTPAVVFAALSFVGSGLLAWIATRLWRIRRLDSGERFRFSPAKLAGMILLNGVLWSYWVTVCVPQAVALGRQVRYGEYLFLALVQSGWLSSTLLAVLAFSRARGLLSNPRLVPAVFRTFAAIFLYFALSMAYTSMLSIAHSSAVRTVT